MPHKNELEYAPIGQLLWKFSIPAIVGTLVTTLYNVVDRIFLGRYVGETGIAATAVSFPLMLIMMATGMLIAFGTNSLMSIKLGEKNMEEAEELLGQGIFLFVLQGFIISVLGLLFLEPMLRFFGATDTILPAAKLYLGIVLIGVIPHEISFGVNNFIRGEGSPRIAMVTMVTGGLINIVLDYIFIARFGWGVKGAAAATVIGYSVSAIWVMWHYLSGRSKVKLYGRNFRMRLSTMPSVLAMGAPHCTMGLIASMTVSLFNNQLAKFGGDTAISVYGVMMSFNSISLMPIIGLSQGSQPIIGYNHGAKRHDRVKKTLLISLIAVTIMCSVIAAFMQTYPEKIFEAFIGSSHPEMIDMGAKGITIIYMMLPFLGYMILFSNYFQFTKRPATTMFLTVFRMAIIQIPLLLILPGYFGIKGVWYTGMLTETITLIVTIGLTIREFKRLNKLINKEKP
jgi:putative MATE family efflux protein